MGLVKINKLIKLDAYCSVGTFGRQKKITNNLDSFR